MKNDKGTSWSVFLRDNLCVNRDTSNTGKTALLPELAALSDKPLPAYRVDYITNVMFEKVKNIEFLTKINFR